MSDEPSIALPRQRIARFGWKPDVPDFRDLKLENEPLLPAVPHSVRKFSLRDREPEPSYDQGQLGSCTGNGCGFVWQFEAAKQGRSAERPSRLFIYYWERYIEHTVNEDSGAQIRDGMKVLSRYGAPPETLWPYDVARFAERPPAAAAAEGQNRQALKYLRCMRSIPTIKSAIYAGFPVVMGFSVYESFESDEVAKTGRMPMPTRNEQLLGGHCVVWMGWDDDAPVGNTHHLGAFEARNSWGPDWGDQGHFWMPYEYATNADLSDDFWTCRQVE